MPIYRIKTDKLFPLKTKFFDREKPLQTLIESNLKELFGFDIVASEFNLENFWIDTLAFNPETQSFYILEYKKTESWSLMDQGQTYLNLLLDHKADVLVAYNEKYHTNKKLKDIAWDQCRTLFISPSFTNYQQRALAPDLPFELWQVKLFEENLLSLTKIEPLVFQRTQASRKTLSGTAAKEIKVYTLNHLLQKSSPLQKELILELREKILEIDQDISEIVSEYVVTYKLKRSFVQLWPVKQKARITVAFHKGRKLNDPQKLLKGRGKIGAFLRIENKEDIPLVMSLVLQAYKRAME